MSTRSLQSFTQDRIGFGAMIVALIGVAAVLASAAGSAADLVWLTRPFAFLGMIGGVGALVCAVRCPGTGRKALFAMAGVALLIAGSTIFGMSYPH
ncbi:hypothetical protein [Enemella sp. A6]|uniref:hypothetical protein n=1 Tax=Enemella sp. A6 TaxID=3440152 RepID=UPI003EBCDBB4